MLLLTLEHFKRRRVCFAPSAFFQLSDPELKRAGPVAIFSLDLGPEPLGSLATPLSLDERTIPERRRYVTGPEVKNRICLKVMQISDWYTHEHFRQSVCPQPQAP